MFVMNCAIDYECKLKVQEKGDEDDDVEEYFSVKCGECDVEVGVYEEKEEIYHFFNVIAG